MSDNFAVAATPQAHAADTEFFVRKGMTKGYEFASLIAPPLYIALATARYGRAHLSVNRVLRATWISGSAGAYIYRRSDNYADVCMRVLSEGIVAGGSFEYVRLAYSNEDKVRIRRIRAVYDVRRFSIYGFCDNRQRVINRPTPYEQTTTLLLEPF